MTLKLPDPLATIPRFNLLYPSGSPIHPLHSLPTSSSRNKPTIGDTTTFRGTTTGEKRSSRVRISLYAKREDHSSPLLSSGNKYRKLEYIVPDILSPRPRFGAGVAAEYPALGPEKVKGKITTLVTEGAIQSNHTVQVAATAKRIGLEAVVLLHKSTGGGLAAASNKEGFLKGGNVQVLRCLGGDVRILEPEGLQERSQSQTQTQDEIVENVLDELRNWGKTPYWIPSGASLHPLGGAGYARCAFEIVRQEREILPSSESGIGEGSSEGEARFDYIFVACGSGSTLGGLIAGFKLLEKTKFPTNQTKRPRKIIGILTSPTAPKSYHEARVLRFARQTGSLIGLDPEKDISMTDIHLDDRFVGSAYGVLDPQTKEALKLMADKEEVMLDPVYTAKVVRGMMHWVGGGEIEADIRGYQGQRQERQGVNVLFIHTGGQSALGAYTDV
ncbi:tryptophan synthase beta subunit-like PLP-dependent enzyme [Aspergillus cavernicola]|uniref:Tryptophan synthase beta subunit-like PLP-dependent enzyme n=1 Tax=Aspergillus cavernicola TaxID=176166 RepID=A0ABR4IDY8_9EURO